MNKELLKQQLAKLREEIVEIESLLVEPEKFELEYIYSDFYISHTETADSCINNPDFLEHGRYRKTKEGAELSLARNKRANRLEALVEYLGGLREFEVGEENYYIYKYDDTWDWDYAIPSYQPEKVYMTKECAIKVCELLNSGRYTL